MSTHTVLRVAGRSTITMVVAPGKTIITPTSTLRPGDDIELQPLEAKRLESLGVVHTPGETVMTLDSHGRRVPLSSLPGTYADPRLKAR